MSLTTELQNFGISGAFTSEGIDRVLRTAMKKGGSLADSFSKRLSRRAFSTKKAKWIESWKEPIAARGFA